MQSAGVLLVKGKTAMKYYSTFEIANMLQVDPGSVSNWIDHNLLKAYRTPGGHRRVNSEDLLRFLGQHSIPVPSELVSGPKRVLVVDGKAAQGKSIAAAIRKSHPDFQVEEVHDGFHAGAYIASFKPDMVIINHGVPGVDPVQICKEIRSQAATAHAAIVAMTGSTSARIIKKLRDSGAGRFIPGPLDMTSLLQEVDASVSARAAG
jgi:excisionase family DNA binding protein